MGLNLCNISLGVSPSASSLSSINNTIPYISSPFISIWSLTISYLITGLTFWAVFFVEDLFGGLALFSMALFGPGLNCSVIYEEFSFEFSCSTLEDLGEHFPLFPDLSLLSAMSYLDLLFGTLCTLVNLFIAEIQCPSDTNVSSQNCKNPHALKAVLTPVNLCKNPVGLGKSALELPPFAASMSGI